MEFYRAIAASEYEALVQPPVYMPAGKWVTRKTERFHIKPSSSINCIQSSGGACVISQEKELVTESGLLLASLPDNVLEFKINSDSGWIAYTTSGIYVGLKADYKALNNIRCSGISAIHQTGDFWAISGHQAILINGKGYDIQRIHSEESFRAVTAWKHPRVAIAAGEHMYWIDSRERRISLLNSRFDVAAYEKNMSAWRALASQDNYIAGIADRQNVMAIYDARIDRSALAEWSLTARYDVLLWEGAHIAAVTRSDIALIQYDNFPHHMVLPALVETTQGCCFSANGRLKLVHSGNLVDMEFLSPNE